MKILPSKKKRILKYSLGIGISAILTVTIVGGYLSSISKNPYKNYYRTPATDATQSFLSTFYSAVVDGANLLLLPGFTLINPLNLALEDSWFNKTGFLLIDEAYMGNRPYQDNSVYFSSQVSSVQFRADQGSFITGIAMAMYLNVYKEYFLKNDDKLTWSTFGGGDNIYDAVVAFMSGFQKGVDWFNKYVVPKDKNLVPVEQIFLGNSFPDNFSGSFGPAGGNAIIDKFLVTTKTDCLIPIAGAQTADAVAKIAGRQNQRTIVIGVDSPMELNKKIMNYKLPKDNKVPSPENILPFSSVKNIDEICSKIISKINDPSLNSNNGLHGFGWHNIGGISNNGVGVSTPGQEYFLQALKYVDQSLVDYREAIKKLNTFSEFSNLDKPNVNGIDNVYRGEYKVQQNIYNYQTNISGYEFPEMSENRPNGISKEISEVEWDKKRNFNLSNFIKLGNLKDKNKIKLILSSSDAILLDGGFSQVTYLAIFRFYKENNIKIPEIK